MLALRLILGPLVARFRGWIRRCGIAGGRVSLEMDFEVSKAQVIPS